MLGKRVSSYGCTQEILEHKGSVRVVQGGSLLKQL